MQRTLPHRRSLSRLGTFPRIIRRPCLHFDGIACCLAFAPLGATVTDTLYGEGSPQHLGVRHRAHAPRVVVVMGAAGTGRTTVGVLSAARLGVPYAAGDGFRPRAGIARMSAGVPLTDEDRRPWLDAIGAWACGRAGLGGVIGGSAPRRACRDRVRAAAPGIVFVHLTGDRARVEERPARLRGHFTRTTPLGSRLAALQPLEPDEAGVTVDVSGGPEEITDRVVDVLRDLGRSSAVTPDEQPHPGHALRARRSLRPHVPPPAEVLTHLVGVTAARLGDPLGDEHHAESADHGEDPERRRFGVGRCGEQPAPPPGTSARQGVPRRSSPRLRRALISTASWSRAARDRSCHLTSKRNRSSAVRGKTCTWRWKTV